MIFQILFGIFYLFCDVFYWAKYAASVVAFRLRKRIKPGRLNVYDFEVENEPEKVGFIIPKQERELESPFPEEHLQDAADELFLYGVNSKSESLVLRVSRAPNDEAEAFICLKLQDGRSFELRDTSGHQRNYGGKCTSFTCGGLQMYYLVPMRRWRIVYCGMLKERSKNSENDGIKDVFVKFTFLWKASSDAFDATSDLDIRLTADAVARAKWTSLIPPVDKVSEVMNLYCQSGVINGTVSIEDEPEVQMYLFGERTRNLSKSSYLLGCKFKHILGVVPASGLVLHLCKASAPAVFHKLHYGFIVHPDTFNRVIEDAIIITRMSGSAESDENLTATFKAGRQFELHGKFEGECVNFTNKLGWDGCLELRGIEFDLDGLKGKGFMISGEFLSLPAKKHRRILPTIVAPHFTVSFTEDVCCLPDLTGGKGSSLGTLTKLSGEMKSEFIVPKGIVVTTAAYKEFLSSDIISEITKLKDIAYGNVYGDIQDACQIVKSAIERAHLPNEITEEIKEKLLKIFSGNIDHLRFAVRSSATGEDTDQMSAAGQMDTFLGVRGLNEIFAAVKKCWASQFAYIATEYKRQNGQILNSPMAVVIQEMVECDSAGVLFTCDPVTNNPSVAVITGNYGLGESVVSGTEEPDTIVLKKLPMNEVEIKSVSVGLKQHRIVMTETQSDKEESTVVSEDVPEDKRNECCISQEMALRLGKLSMKIEEYFKSPRDIEWGIKGNNIYILQSRPITTGATASDYEIMHEFDGPLRCEGEYFTICNVGEVMPGASSPLGIDVMCRYFAALFNKKIMKEGKQDSFLTHVYFPSGMLPFYNHLVMTVVDLLTRGSEPDSLASQGTMIGVFGRILEEPELRVLAKYRELKKKRSTLPFLLGLLWSFFSGQGIEKLKEDIFSRHVLAENGRSSAEVFDLVLKSCSAFTNHGVKHIICSGLSSMWNMFMFATLGSAKGGYDNTVYSDFAQLLSTSTMVESADVPSALQKLAKRIAEDIKSEEFKSMTPEDALEWLETSKSTAGVKFREFIKRHGHRCLKELDVYSVPWYLDSKPLVKTLQNMVGSVEEVKEKQEVTTSELLSKLSVPLNFKTKLLLRFLLPNCRRGVRERETCKSILVKVFDIIRKGFVHLSQMMVAEGYLPDKELIFFLTIDEIQDLIENRNPRLIARANHRRKLFPVLDSYLYPDVFKGLPIPINQNQEDEIEYVADLTMKGIPVSQGTVRGYARVAISLQEAAHLQPGEILITYCTDIAWSPYFPILGGVVTELGGLISHGAVVSREYGLPCVVGLHGATKQFITGDYVLLDGNKGILQRLSPPEH